MTTRAKLFKSNRSQAVRLPKAIAFSDGVKEVEITRSGRSLIITPVPTSWADYFENGPFLTDDFDVGREDWRFEEREPLE